MDSSMELRTSRITARGEMATSFSNLLSSSGDAFVGSARGALEASTLGSLKFAVGDPVSLIQIKFSNEASRIGSPWC